MLIISHALCTSTDYDYNDCKRNKNTNLHPKSSHLGEFCLSIGGFRYESDESMNKIDSFELIITKKKGFGSPNDLGCNPYICAHNKLISLSALLCSINYRL